MRLPIVLPGKPRPRLGVTHAAAAVAALLAAGCTHAGFGSIDNHYSMLGVTTVQGAVVEVCHAYGCRTRTRYRFSPKDLADIAALMDKTRKADTAHEERRAVAYAIGWMERKVGAAIGTDTDRAGMDFVASGDPTQQDCVDEATNTTSYLMVLQNAGFLKHHRVAEPFARENYLRGIEGWTHWTAVLVEGQGEGQGEGGERWAVDSWIYENGENPAIVRADEWYQTDLASLPRALR